MTKTVPSVSVTYARTGKDQKSNELGMRPMQERACAKRGEQYLLIKFPPVSAIDRRFSNRTERLGKPVEMHSGMTKKETGCIS